MAASARDDHEEPGLRTTYALPGARVAIRADDELVRWLDEFLLPAFDLSDPAPGDDVVVVTLKRESSALPEPEDEDGARPCFALDREVVEIRAWDTDGAVIVDDRKYEATYRLAVRRSPSCATPPCHGRARR